MTFRKHFAVIFILFISLFSLLSAESSNITTLKGSTLSDKIYTNLQKNKFQPVSQPLLNNGENAFPYNIYVNFPSENASDKTLLLIFSQKQILQSEDFIFESLRYIKNNTYDFNITVLFSYGDKQIIQKQIVTYGTNVFIDSLNSNEDYTVIFFDLDNTDNKVLTSSNRIQAPAWLIQNEYNIFLQQKLKDSLPFYYVSQIYRLNFFRDQELSLIFENDIPGIKLCLTKETVENGKAKEIVTSTIEKFAETENKLWEYHFLLLNFFGNYIYLTESAIIKIIITIIFSWLLFIFLLGFINRNVKNETWSTIKKIWYSIPLTFSVCFLSFFLGRIISSYFSDSISPYKAIYYCTALQLSLSFLLITLFYLIILLLNHHFSEKSLDFLLVIACFLNQSFFILVDISLFPIYMALFSLSILGYYIKNNWHHIVIFVFMLGAIIPYANTIINYGNSEMIKEAIYLNKIVPFTISLTIYPIYIIYLRILTSFRNHFKKTTSLLITSVISFLFIFIALFTFAFIRSTNLKHKAVTNTNYSIIKTNEDLITFDYNDKHIFNDTIRTISINLEGSPEVCEVRLTGISISPVLYSDNEFVSISNNSAVFKIPDNPPEHMTFSYGTTNEICNVIISALYPVENETNIYKICTKVFTIEAH